MTIKFSPPDITEEEVNEVADTLRSGWLTTGPKTKLLETRLAEYVGSSRCACLNSATAAMELTLRLFGIGEGDEVITTAYTYTASASVICHVGAKPVIVDTCKDSFEISAEAAADKITPRTKAIIPVDFGGVICGYDKLFDALSSRKDLFSPKNEMQESIGRALILADAAHSFGSMQNGLVAGNQADFSCFSFHTVKNLAVGEGGCVVWKTIDGIDDDEIYSKYMLLSLHGQTKDALAKAALGSWEYDIVFPGYKCNMTDIAAALGLVQLKRYPDFLKRRGEIVEIYERIIPCENVCTLKHEGESFLSNKYLYVARLLGKDEASRNKTISLLGEKGIPANVHFKPLPLLTAYKNMGYNIKDFPNAYNMYKNAVSLPIHTSLSDADAEYIAGNFIEIVNRR